MTDDVAQLRRYAHEGAEEAFAQLVARHLPLVYSAALRQVGGDAHLAKDVAQSVFIALARNAPSLCRREIISGWLYTTTRYLAAKVVRSERRRQIHEQASAAMHELLSQPDAEADWSRVGPVLDEAMARLSRKDRNAVLLRFFKNEDLKTVGAALGVSEDAARMRVNRALEKLRGLLEKRGITCSASALAMSLGWEAVGAVPAELAASITGTAMAGAVASGGVAAPFLKALLMTKLKVGIVGVVVTVGVVAPWVIQRQAQTRLQDEIQALRLKSERVDAVLADNARLSNLLAEAKAATAQRQAQLAELARLRGESQRLGQQVSQLKELVAANEPRGSGSDAGKASDDPNTETLNMNLPAASLAFAGYATPTDALQTFMWAKRAGDTKALVASLAPDFVRNARKAWGDQFEDKLKSSMGADPEWVTNFCIEKMKVISGSEVGLTYKLTGAPQRTLDNKEEITTIGNYITLQRVGDEWKLDP